MDWADLAEYMIGRTRADEADSRADGADYGILDEVDWGGRGRTGRTTESWMGRTEADGTD